MTLQLEPIVQLLIQVLDISTLSVFNINLHTMSLPYTREKKCYLTCLNGFYMWMGPWYWYAKSELPTQGALQDNFFVKLWAISLQILVADKCMRPPKMDLASPKTYT